MAGASPSPGGGRSDEDGLTEVFVASNMPQCVKGCQTGRARSVRRDPKRNAAVVLGNVSTVEDLPVLRHALANPEPLVREHAAWALKRLRAGGGS